MSHPDGCARYVRKIGNVPAMGHKPQLIAGALEHSRIIGVAQASRIRRNLSAHAPQIRRRTGERRQDPRCRGLLLPSLGKLSTLAFELVFQRVDDAAKVLICASCWHFGWHDHANPLNYQPKTPKKAKVDRRRTEGICNPKL